MVMLKNNGILPLDPSKIKTIGVIGPNADSRPALEGNYNGRADRYITFLEGIQDAFDGNVLYSEGSHLYKDRCMQLGLPDDRIAEAEIVAEHSDVVVLCVGLDATIEGEEGDTGNEFSSGDKNDLRLPEAQRKLVKAVMSKGKPVIMVIAAGSAINPEADCDALIQEVPGACVPVPAVKLQSGPYPVGVVTVRDNQHILIRYSQTLTDPTCGEHPSGAR